MSKARSSSKWLSPSAWTPETTASTIFSRDAIVAGKTTAIYYTGAIEQNGPGVALGKHLFIAHYLAQRIAEQLGNALIYPTMPFAPTGDWGLTSPGVIDPA